MHIYSHDLIPVEWNSLLMSAIADMLYTVSVVIAAVVFRGLMVAMSVVYSYFNKAYDLNTDLVC
jgi:ABC-type siderophore export system fused ATPase/permease subunit